MYDVIVNKYFFKSTSFRFSHVQTLLKSKSDHENYSSVKYFLYNIYEALKSKPEVSKIVLWSLFFVFLGNPKERMSDKLKEEALEKA